MTIKEKINEFLKKLNYTDEEITALDSSSVYIAQQIAAYAHRKQKRLNGENYFTHPYCVMQLYRNLVGIVENDYFCMDKDLLESCDIPYNGVQETCLLHDVLEDTDVSENEIEEVFDKLSLGEYYRSYIKTPLFLITHDKTEDYTTYISKLIDNQTASLVKFLDMSDNINPSSLIKFSDFETKRIEKYVLFCKIINDRWHFLENADNYRKQFNSTRS